MPEAWTRLPHWPDYLYLDRQERFTVAPGVIVDEEMFRTCAAGVGGDKSLQMLIDLVDRGVIDLERTPAVVGAAWSDYDPYPNRPLPPKPWVDLFKAAGYTHNGKSAERPTEAVTLYRGATPDGRFGMSWTTDLQAARQFAFAGMRGRLQGAVYTATIEPAGLLAYIDSERGGEVDYIVDPDYLSDDNVRLLEATPPPL